MIFSLTLLKCKLRPWIENLVTAKPTKEKDVDKVCGGYCWGNCEMYRFYKYRSIEIWTPWLRYCLISHVINYRDYQNPWHWPVLTQFFGSRSWYFDGFVFSIGFLLFSVFVLILFLCTMYWCLYWLSMCKCDLMPNTCYVVLCLNCAPYERRMFNKLFIQQTTHRCTNQSSYKLNIIVLVAVLRVNMTWMPCLW